MKLDYFKVTLKNIIHRKLRSYLTIIGIVIGVTALVALITLGKGLEDGMTEQFDNFGTNVIWIGPKSVGGFGGPPVGVTTLTERDAEAVERLTIVDFTAPFLAEGLSIEYNREEMRHEIFAPDAAVFRRMLENVDIKLAEGRYLEDGDGNVAVIGWRIHKDMFTKEVPLQASFLINDKKFRVVGIKEEQGTIDEDNQIIIPLDAMRELINVPEGISAFSAIIHDGVNPEDASLRIARELERRRGDENFEVTSPVKIKEQVGVILSVVTWVVSAIASISLIVGGLGIMNTMYSAILERTREIGVMKAIGARNSDILSLILIESGCLGFIGGIIGILLGLGLTYLAAGVINTAGVVRIAINIRYSLLLFGLVFSFGLGTLSGALPAMRASHLAPVDALRYE